MSSVLFPFILHVDVFAFLPFFAASSEEACAYCVPSARFDIHVGELASVLFVASSLPIIVEVADFFVLRVLEFFSGLFPTCFAGAMGC